jgi:hypothetical protein
MFYNNLVTAKEDCSPGEVIVRLYWLGRTLAYLRTTTPRKLPSPVLTVVYAIDDPRQYDLPFADTVKGVE